jgi:hypothetical protein
MSGKVVYRKWITRDMLRRDPDARFVFGDNVDRAGMGGQAGEMRHERNAIGVATKWHPGCADEDYFADDDDRARAVIDADIDKVVAALIEGRTVYVPYDGLGTGLSQLPLRAPTLHHHIVDRFAAISGEDFPWRK